MSNVIKHSNIIFMPHISPLGGIETYVYDRLVHYGQSVTAKAYEGYRAVQEFKRNVNTTDESILGLIHKTNEDVLMLKYIKQYMLITQVLYIMAKSHQIILD